MTPEHRVSIAFLLRLDQIRFIKIIDGRILSLYVSDDQLLHLFQSIRSRHPVSEELCHYRANDIKGSRIRIPADFPFKLYGGTAAGKLTADQPAGAAIYIPLL